VSRHFKPQGSIGWMNSLRDVTRPMENALSN